MNTISLRTPLIECRSALSLLGFRTQEDFDELIHVGQDGEFRLSLGGRPHGQQVKCFISLAEERLLTSGIELFHEMAVEGHPVVSYGAGHGSVSFGFEWYHPAGADWKISAQRIELLMQRLVVALGPKPAPVRRRLPAGRKPSMLSELVPALVRPLAA
ncbi:MAG: hypothetical protein KF715_16600 [Candidatus Didemnitutus sp.]|nr:hypothetical protein [Candidatus Didemnitutus sp.]